MAKQTQPVTGKTDPFGHPIEIGTTVRFFAVGYRFKSILGKVVKMTDKTLEVEHEHFNIPGHVDTTKQGYAQVFVDTTGWIWPSMDAVQQLTWRGGQPIQK